MRIEWSHPSCLRLTGLDLPVSSAHSCPRCDTTLHRGTRRVSSVAAQATSWGRLHVVRTLVRCAPVTAENAEVVRLVIDEVRVVAGRRRDALARLTDENFALAILVMASTVIRVFASPKPRNPPCSTRLACTLPAETGLKLSRWSATELAAEVRARSIAEAISASTVRRDCAPMRSSPGNIGPGSFPATATSQPRPPGSWICIGVAGKTSRWGLLNGQDRKFVRGHAVGGWAGSWAGAVASGRGARPHPRRSRRAKPARLTAMSAAAAAARTRRSPGWTPAAS